MIAEFSSAVGGLKAASDILKGMAAFKTESERAQAVIEVQRAILDIQSAAILLQQENALLTDTIGQLKKEAASGEEWLSEMKRYSLREISRGVFAYLNTDGMPSGEPAHWLCAKCLGKKEKSFLQLVDEHIDADGTPGPFATYHCDTCSTDFRVDERSLPGKEWVVT